MARRNKQIVMSSLLLGMLANGSVQAASAVRTTAFEHDPVTGLLTKTIVEPDIPHMRVETSYGHDQWGNKVIPPESKRA